MIRMNIQIIQFDVAKSQNQFQLIRREPVVDAGFPSIPLILIRLVARPSSTSSPNCGLPSNVIRKLATITRERQMNSLSLALGAVFFAIHSTSPSYTHAMAMILPWPDDAFCLWVASCKLCSCHQCFSTLL